MIGKMERTANKLFETYIGGLEIDNRLCIQTACRTIDGGFLAHKLLLSREAVVTLIPLLEEWLKGKEGKDGALENTVDN